MHQHSSRDRCEYVLRAEGWHDLRDDAGRRMIGIGYADVTSAGRVAAPATLPVPAYFLGRPAERWRGALHPSRPPGRSHRSPPLATHGVVAEIVPDTGGVGILRYVVVATVALDAVAVRTQFDGDVRASVARGITSTLPSSPRRFEVPDVDVFQLEPRRQARYAALTPIGAARLMTVRDAVLRAVNDALRDTSAQLDSAPVRPGAVLAAIVNASR